MSNNFNREGYDPSHVSGSSHYRVGHSRSPRDPRDESRRRIDSRYRDHSRYRSDSERSGYHNISRRHSRDLDVNKSKLALDIINAVIGYKSNVNRRDRSPPRKQFRGDRGGMRPHEELPRDHHHSQSVWERLGGPSHHHPSHSGSGDLQDRRMSKSHQSKPLYNARTSESSSSYLQSMEENAVPTHWRGSSKRNKWEAKEETKRKNDVQGKGYGKNRNTTEDQESSEKTKESLDQEEEDEEELTEELLSLPREALKCHICDKKLFVSPKSYLEHIRGRAHNMMRSAYQDTINAQIALLQANSKMAECNLINSTMKFSKRKCNICNFHLASMKRYHNKTKEHKLLVRYMLSRCCGMNFFTRNELEDHRLTLEHHKNEWYKNGEVNNKKEEEDINQIEEENQQEENEEEEEIKKHRVAGGDLRRRKGPNEEEFDNMREELYRKSDHPEAISLRFLEPYDPIFPYGLNFLSKKSTYQCGVCPNSRLVNGNTIERHFHSLLHYSNLHAHLELQPDEMEQEKEKCAKKIEAEEVKKTITSGSQELEEKLEEVRKEILGEKGKELAENGKDVGNEENKVKVDLPCVKGQNRVETKKEEEELEKDYHEKEQLLVKLDQHKEQSGEEPEELINKMKQDKKQDKEEKEKLVKIREKDKGKDREEMVEIIDKGEQDKEQEREEVQEQEKEDILKTIDQNKEKIREENEERVEDESEQNEEVEEKRQSREEKEEGMEDESKKRGEEQEKDQGRIEEEEITKRQELKMEEDDHNFNEDKEVDMEDIDNMETVDEVCDDDEMTDQDSCSNDEDDEIIDLQEVGEEIDTDIGNMCGEEQE
ncbi:hypothetical protein Pmani_021475 [Petrolisthes manimaculis]|uniref:Uncharacterized protein n=1 Tax=Petrolisthes manimaculis TaxID=1843537 RepID=A0AAE1PG64_9EUCA|nr:hypothetical protein Pmani_021475 [Petrolisthes manimaculis]